MPQISLDALLAEKQRRQGAAPPTDELSLLLAEKARRQQVPTPLAEPSLWQRVTTGLVSPETITNILAGPEVTEQIASRRIGEALPGENPSQAYWRTLREGLTKSGAENLSTFTSPASIAMMGAGLVGRIPGTVGTIARTFPGLASLGLGAQGAQQAIEAQPLTGQPEEVQKFLGGAGMAAGGAAGTLATVRPKFATAPIRQSPTELKNTMKAAVESVKQAGAGVTELPSHVIQRWTNNAENLLKQAQEMAYHRVKSFYPKVKFKPDPKVLDALLPAEHPLAGIRAAREKLETTGMTEEGIRNARSELWTYRKRVGLPTDEFKAYSDTYGNLTKYLQQQYKAVGRLDQFRTAEKEFGKFMETFHNPRSPVAKAMKAQLPATGLVEPSSAIRPLATEVGKQQLGILREQAGIPRSVTEWTGGRPPEIWSASQAERFANPNVASGISFTYKIPLLRQAFEYLLTRPVLYKSLQPSQPAPLVTSPLPPWAAPESFVRGYPAPMLPPATQFPAIQKLLTSGRK